MADEYVPLEYPKWVTEAGCIVHDAEQEARVRAALAAGSVADVVSVVRSAQGEERTVASAPPEAPSSKRAERKK